MDSLFSVDCVLALWYLGVLATFSSGIGYSAKHKRRTGEPWLFHCRRPKMTCELGGLCIVIILARNWDAFD